MKTLILAISLFATFSGLVFAASMEFPNKKGTVFFDHEKHRSLPGVECTSCHERPGEIKGFGKMYAHSVCIGCHEPGPGKIEGPITCDGCHTRS